MISFTIALVCLILGYLFYGRYVSHVFGPDDRPTPAIYKADGVDYVAMPVWKIFMIQFLNIAGTGPIFGAIMGAMFGPSSYLWIIFGCIFAGATHDYLSGMLSLRMDGASLPEMIGKYLGGTTKKFMLVFTVLLLILVGAVFVSSPALLLRDMTTSVPYMDLYFWIIVIFIYYVIATLLPIDKIIGKIYPVFAFALLFMALGLMIALFLHWPAIPEITDGLQNLHPDKAAQPIFPCLFITIACGAISGFHATQSPLMARCLKHEKYGYPVFYGAMITEGVVALVWAAVSSYFFFDPSSGNTDMTVAAPKVVEIMSNKWLGTLGGILAILGVVAAPITSGDTAFRSARLIIADSFHIAQKAFMPRLYIAIPLFGAAILLLVYNLSDPAGFNVIWGYFAWANQTMAMFTLWTVTVYLVRRKKPYIITLIPSVFMTAVSVTFLCISDTALGLSHSVSYTICLISVIASLAWFGIWYIKKGKNQIEKD
jgi:carbon starvation protein CstA